MQRLHPSHLLITMLAIIALFISGCTQSKQPTAAFPENPPPPSSSPTPLVTAEKTADIQSTENMTVATNPAGSTLPAPASCSSAEIDSYMNAVLPLTDEHAVDSLEAQKLAALTDETQILALRSKALGRLESLGVIQAPACLNEAHGKLTLSFELLVSAWELIQAKDYSTATTTLQNSYEALSEGMAKIVILKQGG